MRKARWVLPVAVLLLALGLWELICVTNAIPHYILPRPGLVIWTLFAEWPLLFSALLNTLKIMILSLMLAVVGGVGLAVIFSQSKWVEMSFFPFAVILQVTPIVAIFPLINIYVDDQTAYRRILIPCSNDQSLKGIKQSPSIQTTGQRIAGRQTL